MTGEVPGRRVCPTFRGVTEWLAEWPAPVAVAYPGPSLLARIMYNRAMTEILPLAEARNRLSELATTVETTHERVIVTRNGRPVLALVALGDIEALEETLDLLSDPEAMADIHRSAAEIEAGRLIPATREQTLAWLHDEA